MNDGGSVIPERFARVLVGVIDDTDFWLADLRRRSQLIRESAHVIGFISSPWWCRWWHTVTGHR